MENDDSAVQYAIGRSDTVAPGVGIDLEFDADVQTMSPEASEYETCYVTSHKGPCRVASYSRDGQLIATGSADASIKILDTERMLAKSAMPIEVSKRSQWCLNAFKVCGLFSLAFNRRFCLVLLAHDCQRKQDSAAPVTVTAWLSEVLWRDLRRSVTLKLFTDGLS